MLLSLAGAQAFSAAMNWGARVLQCSTVLIADRFSVEAVGNDAPRLLSPTALDWTLTDGTIRPDK
jgi:hypothetical protein